MFTGQAIVGLYVYRNSRGIYGAELKLAVNQAAIAARNRLKKRGVKKSSEFLEETQTLRQDDNAYAW